MARKIIFRSPPALAANSLLLLAAGLGTRLRPLTADRPKALVEVAGVPLLAAQLNRLRSSRPRQLLINAHYRADRLESFLKGAPVAGWRSFRLLQETQLLDTGGALKRAAFLVRGEALVTVNVDIASDLHPALVVAEQRRRPALATLLLHDYPRYNQVEVATDGRIVAFGRRRAASGNRLLAYTGIQVCASLLLSLLRREPETVFPLIPFYQRLLASGRRDLRAVVVAADSDYYWRDIGTPAELAALERDLEQRPDLARRLGFVRGGRMF